MSPRENKDKKECKDKSKHLKKQLSRYVTKSTAAPKDSKVKMGLFQKGLCSKYLRRDKGPLNANKFARVKGDLNKIISLVNDKPPSLDCDENKYHNKSHSESKHNSLISNSPPKNRTDVADSAQQWGTSSDSEKRANDSKAEKSKTPAMEKSTLFNDRNFKNFANTLEVKKARTANFVNSLPSILDESINPQPNTENCENQAPVENHQLRETHRLALFHAHVSAIGFALVNLKKKSFPHSSYNQTLKNAILEEHNLEMSGSSSSTCFSGSPDQTFKNPLAVKTLHFNTSEHSVNLKSAVKSSPSIILLSPPRLSSPPLVSSFLGKENALNDSQVSSVPLASQAFNSQPLNSQPFNSEPSNPEFSAPYISSQIFHSQLLNSLPSTSDFLMPHLPHDYHMSMPNSQNSANSNYLNLDNSLNRTQREKSICPEVNKPLDPLQFPPTPPFKFYPRNMF